MDLPIEFRISEIRSTLDGGYIACGEGIFGLAKVGPASGIQWIRLFDNKNIRTVRETKDKGYILDAREWDGGSISIIKTDETGVTQWECKTNSTWALREGLEQTTDGGYIVWGNKITKVSADGKLLWEFSDITQPDFGKETLDGGYIFFGKSSDSLGQSVNLEIIKLNSAGIKEWETPGIQSIDREFEVLPTSDGGFLFASPGNRNDTGFSSINLLKTDVEGNKEWTNTVNLGINVNSIQLSKELDVGGFIVVGLRDNIILAKVDSRGNTEWAKKLEPGPDFDDWSYYADIQQLPDGGFKILLLSFHPPGWSLPPVIYEISGYIKIRVNDKLLKLDVDPIITEGRTLVPIRAVSEGLGASVLWDQRTKTVTLYNKSMTINLKIGDKKALVNNETVYLDVAPVIIDGRTMIPIRFISESFGAQVDWDEITKTVKIKY